MSDPTYYFDFMGSTPMDPLVLEVLVNVLNDPDYHINPHAIYNDAIPARRGIDAALSCIGDCIHADPAGLIVTSGASESINLALKGACQFYRHQGRHVITLATEHQATRATCQALQTNGFEVTELAVDNKGHIDLATFERHIRDDTLMISLSHINNEIGTIHPIEAISEITQRRGLLLHVDAAQSLGRAPVDLAQWQADYVSFSAHKCYGPKGIGLLYCRTAPKRHVMPLLHGGGQQQGKRSGTLAPYLILAFAKAIEVATTCYADDHARAQRHQRMIMTALNSLPMDTTINGDLNHGVPHNLNLLFNDRTPEQINHHLKNFAITQGANCSAAHHPSHVLMALGRTRNEALSSRRICLGRTTTDEDVHALIKAFTALGADN